MRRFQLFSRKSRNPESSSTSNGSALISPDPPQWAPAPEPIRYYGKLRDAPGQEYDTAEEFCDQVPLDSPKLLPSNTLDKINKMGCRAWGIEPPVSPRFKGSVDIHQGLSTVQTEPSCESVSLFSDIPIIAGLYDTQGKIGVYYEVCIKNMDGLIAIGTACRPYPDWRLPGWNRMSAGYHLDDFCKFFEEGGGGSDYSNLERIRSGDTVGCGYEFRTGILFYTHNGLRLPTAFTGLYLPREKQDVFAAVGVEGHCEFEVNFGGQLFRWKEGNEWAWSVEGHVGRLGGHDHSEEELPSYQQARYLQ